jgi:hypothetical protein
VSSILDHVSDLHENKPVLADEVHREQDLEDQPYYFIDVSDLDFLPNVDQVVLCLVAQLFVCKS